MKTKIITKTYMRDIEKYRCKLFLDEDELIDAYNNGDITREEFDLVYRVKDEILPSIENKNNKLMNIDYKKYIYEF